MLGLLCVLSVVVIRNFGALITLCCSNESCRRAYVFNGFAKQAASRVSNNRKGVGKMVAGGKCK